MTRLAHARYLELLRRDGALLAARAEDDLEAPVPPCPGWDVREVVRHTGSVFRHKVACIELEREPRDGEWEKGPAAGARLLPWFRESLARIDALLSSKRADDPAYTWWPPEQTAGFWARRMALETAVHRADVESAFGAVSPVATELAIDGIDEVLCIFLIARHPTQQHDAATADMISGSLTVRAGEAGWTVRLRPGSVTVDEDAPFATDASLGGDPSAVFLYLWGRGPLESLDCDGDAALVHALRSRLALATR